MNNDSFRQVEILRDPDGVIAVVTERVSNGRISFAIFNEFERDGQTQRSSFLGARHLPAVERLVAELRRNLELWEDQARARRRAEVG